MCDLDGTLALFEGRRNPYDASNCHEVDKVNVPVLKVIQRFQDSHAIIFSSGRVDEYMSQTQKFLENKCGLKDYFLFMRQTGDRRKDSIVKEEMYRNLIEPQFEVLFVMDDRNQVVDKWRELGLTCFQVAAGDF